MRPKLAILAAFLFAPIASHATTLWPELKAYDFCRAYYLEDGGITFLRVDSNEHRGYFHEKRYHYKVVRPDDGKQRIIPLDYINSHDFYLTHWRALEWLDHVFPDVEIHPGEQLWRTRP